MKHDDKSRIMPRRLLATTQPLFIAPFAGNSVAAQPSRNVTVQRHPRILHAPMCSHPSPRSRSTPVMSAALPIFVVLSALQQAVKALVGGGRSSPDAGPSEREARTASKRSVGGTLRDIADGVEADMEELRVALRRETRLREAAEAAAKAASEDLENLRTYSRQEYDIATGQVPKTLRRLFDEMVKAQIRAAAGVRRTQDAQQSAETLQRALASAKADVVLTNAMWVVLVLAIVTFTAHSSGNESFPQSLLRSFVGV